jgi:hypothetical protein
LLAGGIAAALPLLPELTAGLVAVSGAVFAAGAGLASFGAIALTDITNATNATQKLQAAQLAVQNATSNTARADALVKEQALVTSLGPSTIALGQAITSLDGIWKSFAAGFTPEITRDVTAFAGLLTTSLPLIQPLITAGAGAVSTILSNLNTALQSPAAKQFMDWLAGTAEQDILGLTRAFGGFGAGVLELFRAFAPIETLVVNGLSGMGTAFASWATHLASTQGFQDFLKYVEHNGPLLVKTLEDVGAALAHILAALMPALPVLLHILDFAAQVIGSFPSVVILFGTLATAAAAGADKLGLFAGAATTAGDAAGAAGAAGKVGLLGSALFGIPALAVAAGLALSKLSGGNNFGIGNTDLSQLSPDARLAFLNNLPGGVGKKALAQLVTQPGFDGTPLASYLGMGAPLTTADATNYAATAAPVDSFTGGSNIYGTSTYNSQVPGQIGSYFGNSLVDTSGAGTGAPPAFSLPNSSGGGGVSTAVNNAAGIAGLLGLNLMASLAQGITTGTNPLTVAFSDLNQKLTGPAQSLATALQAAFGSMLTFGTTAANSLRANLSSLPGMGSVTNVTVDPKTGQLTSSVQSPLLGQLSLYSAQTSKFASEIAGLHKLGINQDLIEQFVGAGLSSEPQVASLLNSSKADVAQINSLDNQINSTASAYGTQEAIARGIQQTNSLLQQILAMESKTPAATGQHVAAALNGGAARAQVRAATTPSLGVYSTGGRR